MLQRQDDGSPRLILVTGAAGYIGSVLCRQLLARGFRVRGIDLLLFGGAGLEGIIAHPNFQFLGGDLCEPSLVHAAVNGVDAVVHLAAIVGDPACKRFPEQATALMDVASRDLFEAAAAHHVQQFVFASTCSNYGQMEGDVLLDENAPLNPQSHYARLKVGYEEYLLGKMKASPVHISILRFATAYGLSPRMRFDLTVNHFTRDLALGNSLEVFGQHQWRPYCHAADLAHALVLALTLPTAQTQGVFNIGDSAENYTKAKIVEEVLRQIPEGKVTYGPAPDVDTRNYRVDFSKARDQLGFQISSRVPDGIREILEALRSGKISEPYSPIYQNC
jgi:nucleoside-diphosphate-sugar epimerase